MQYIVTDDTLGDVQVKLSKQARKIAYFINPSGTITITAPRRTAKLFIKGLIRSERHAMRTMLQQHRDTHIYRSGDTVGQHYTLSITHGTQASPSHTIRGSVVHIVTARPQNEPVSQQYISSVVKKILTKEARAYLPTRLRVLAKRLGFSYQRVRITHTRTRWGSCSTSGTISLNIALMRCTLEEIDYVIIHELCHTIHMDHSQQFWQLVEQHCPQYRTHCKSMKKRTPSL